MSDTNTPEPTDASGIRRRRSTGVRRRRKTYRETGVKSTVAEGPKAEAARTDPDTEPDPITRVSLADRRNNMFDVPTRLRKPGWDYKWEVVTIYGAPVDASMLLDTHESGWRICLTKDYQDLMPAGTAPTAPVERYGQRLYTRPMSLSLAAQTEAFNFAKEQEYNRMQSASQGRPKDHQGLRDIPGVRATAPTIDIQMEIAQR